jgi:hypothetical protein
VRRGSMPKPVYILCAESGAEDKTTGLVSHFKVIEELEIRETLAFSPGIAPAAFRAISFQSVAVWARAERDGPDQVYEFKTSLFLPDESQEHILGTGTIAFGNRARLRITVNLWAPLVRPGLLRVEHGIRPVGADAESWLIQSYEIPVIDLRNESSDESSLRA